ncbi:hypothetical protein [Corynebacterium sp. A21]|uniref:hypothetical protein n=1 Tax=Corynebacterium sp. A21 TaxID=3457318 RepID=UPI003FD2A44B
MGFLDRFRRSGPKRIDVPEHLPPVEVSTLHVRTAEQLVVLLTSLEGVHALADAARSRTAVQLRCGDARPVSLIPVPHERSVPTLDPKLGWLIPASPAVCAELARLSGPGEYELANLNLAVVVE